MTPISLVIAVSQDHINRGTYGDCMTCPIALATMDALDHADIEFYHVTVNNTIEVFTANAFLRAVTPPVFAQFIHDFDRGSAVVPLSEQVYFDAS